MTLYLLALILAGFTDDEAGRIAAADVLAERDVRRLAAEWSCRMNENQTINIGAKDA